MLHGNPYFHTEKYFHGGIYLNLFTYPLKKCWNFKVVFQKNSTGIPEVKIWNHSGILIEFHWNSDGILPPILSKCIACFPELFRWNTSHFLVERTGILMEFLRYFLEFGWYFDGIPVKKAMRKVLLAEFNRYFCGIFHPFSHPAIPRNSMGKRPALPESWYFDGNSTPLALLIGTFAEKGQTT